jgi:TPR repeat protein
MRLIKILLVSLLMTVHGQTFGGNDEAESSSAAIIDDFGEYTRCHTAAVSLRASAWRNDPGAQYELGQNYFTGLLVEPDIVQAYRWLIIAASNGHRDAAEYLTTVAEKMSLSQIAEAHILARDWMENRR